MFNPVDSTFKYSGIFDVTSCVKAWAAAAQKRKARRFCAQVQRLLTSQFRRRNIEKTPIVVSVETLEHSQLTGNEDLHVVPLRCYYEDDPTRLYLLHVRTHGQKILAISLCDVMQAPGLE